MSNDVIIGLDYSHNSMLSLEASSYADFTQFLFASGYKLGKIEAGFYTSEKLEMYNAIIMSTPKNVTLKPAEIDVLEEYVRNGGSLLIIGTRGGDYLNRTNLNELNHKFGFELVSDEIFDSVNYVNLQKRPILDNLKPHYITEQTMKIVLSSSCSIQTLDLLETEKKVKTEVLVRGGLNCWRNRFDGEQWKEEDCPRIPLMIAIEYYKGKIVAFGTLSIFSSLGREYGFSAFDNDIIIANILRWLTVDISSEGSIMTINLQKDLYHWLDSVVKKENWENFSDIINVSLKYFKDNYEDIIEEFEKIQIERLERKKSQVKWKKEDIEKIKEEKVVDLIPKRKKEDLVDIISAIEEVSGEKYELSFDLEEEEKKTEEEIKKIGDLPEKLNTLTVKELKAFCKEHDIHLPASARKADIIRVIRYVLGID